MSAQPTTASLVRGWTDEAPTQRVPAPCDPRPRPAPFPRGSCARAAASASTAMRMLLLGVLRWSGFLRLWRFLGRDQIAIVLLHGVMDEADGAGWTPLRSRLSRERLETGLRELARHYRFVSLTEAAEMLAGKRPMKPRSLVFTYDDGYRNNATHALPVMRRFGAPITIFLPTGKIDRRSLFAFDRLDFALPRIPAESISLSAGPVRRTLPLRPRAALEAAFAELREALKAELGADIETCVEVETMVRHCEARAGRSLEDAKEGDGWASLLDWSEVERLVEEPDVEFGSHTVDHVRLGIADAKTARAELRRSRERIEERTHRPCPLLSYPNGSYNAAVADMAREAGYLCAVTVGEGLNRAGCDLMALRRIGIPADAGATELLARVSGLSGALERLKARVISFFGGRS